MMTKTMKNKKTTGEHSAAHVLAEPLVSWNIINETGLGQSEGMLTGITRPTWAAKVNNYHCRQIQPLKQRIMPRKGRD